MGGLLLTDPGALPAELVLLAESARGLSGGELLTDPGGVKLLPELLGEVLFGGVGMAMQLVLSALDLSTLAAFFWYFSWLPSGAFAGCGD